MTTSRDYLRIFVYILLLISPFSATSQDERKIYIIGHRCNNLTKPEKALKQGVNGIEADLWFEDGEWYISHDGTAKQNLDEWLGTMSRLSKEYTNQLAVIIIDIKKKGSIVGLIQKIHQYLPEDLNIVYSVPKISEADNFKEAVTFLRSNEMFSIDAENNPTSVDSFFQTMKFRRGLYGNGIDALILSIENYRKSLTEAGSIRDSSKGFFKTYTWTVERKKTIRKYLDDCKSDGVLVNLDGTFKKPVRRAINICNKLDLKLANRDDLRKELESLTAYK